MDGETLHIFLDLSQAVRLNTQAALATQRQFWSARELVDLRGWPRNRKETDSVGQRVDVVKALIEEAGVSPTAPLLWVLRVERDWSIRDEIAQTVAERDAKIQSARPVRARKGKRPNL